MITADTIIADIDEYFALRGNLTVDEAKKLQALREILLLDAIKARRAAESLMSRGVESWLQKK